MTVPVGFAGQRERTGTSGGSWPTAVPRGVPTFADADLLAASGSASGEPDSHRRRESTPVPAHSPLAAQYRRQSAALQVAGS
ncbi:MAG: hypothetical protein IJH84_24410 [Saccharopolyspora sp.]|uniref:hypothetical protein n=1 Tax=Saccharopolyspora sp. TaxID=33915 RepID=UPI0025EB220C|nr:hypothetical protein [Saccharopolyspora sp.]MBQ6644152.1 hypothetical protein [Saccharopolyspora sp.]